MIKSMTGYGKATSELPGKKITVEIRSLNSKQFDLNLRLAYLYREKEVEIRNEIAKQIERGKIDFSIYVETSGEVHSVSINKPLAKNYYRELKAFAKEIKDTHTHLLPLIVKMPDIWKSEKLELDEKEWKHVKATSIEALKAFNKFRMDEGKTLDKEFALRINNIKTLLAAVEKDDPQRIKNIRDRVLKNINEFVEKEKIDQNRFEQEMIYYLEKIDVAEEKLRLKTHCEYFLKTLQEESAGRKLGFITQEIGREINTLGSKANDATIQKIVVQMKDELEKIKEQLLNVL